MMNDRIMKWLLSLFLTVFAGVELQAQNYTTLTPQILPEVVYPSSDENGVDLANATRDVYGPTLSIGDPANGGIEFKPTIAGWAINSHYPNSNGCQGCLMSGFQGTSNLTAQLTFGGSRWQSMVGQQAQVTAGGKIARFYSTTDAFSGFSEYSPAIGRTLSYSSVPLTNNMIHGNTYWPMYFSEVFTDSDGTRYIFSDPGGSGYPSCQAPNLPGNTSCSYSLPVSRIIRPNGDTLDYYYRFHIPNDFYPLLKFDLLTVVSNRGYMLKFSNSGATVINLTIDACNPIASCSFSRAWPTLSSTGVSWPYLGGVVPSAFTDATGAVTTVNLQHTGQGTGFPYPVIVVGRPNGRIETFSYDTAYANAQGCYNLWVTVNTAPMTAACPTQHLMSYSDGTDTWNYSTTFGSVAGSGGNYITTTVRRTNPKGGVRTTVSIPSGQVVSDTDELGRVTTVNTVAPFLPNEGRILSIAFPEGNGKSFSYDARGNVTQQVDTPKPGSGLANRVTNIAYPATCTNWKICNKPSSFTDPNGKVTTYTWDPNSGQILTETGPADASGINPVKRHSYTQLYAWVSNGSGGYQQASSPVWLLTQMRTCRMTATVANACAGGAGDEVITNYNYGPASGPNNLQLRGVSVVANGATLTTCYGYDVLGNKISETKPNANVAVCP